MPAKRSFIATLFLILAIVRPAGAQVSVLTHHYNTQRTGWNARETTLAPSNAASLHLQFSIPVDEQIDAQPLVIANQKFLDGSVRTAVYVVTENDSIYGIDPHTGQILVGRNLGTPVPQSALPGTCNNNSSVVGINSTPVIDQNTHTIYLITYTYENNTPIWRIHALDLETLADKVPPEEISITAQLDDGTTTTLPAYAMRNRAALLEAYGNIYAAFAGFCDFDGNVARGWVLGWQTGKLTPLDGNYLVNKLATSPNNFFLSGVWMSGSGIATDPGTSTDLFFATGNSDPSGASYSTTQNLSESVVRITNDLKTVVDYFTPSGSSYGQPVLDAADGDLSAGGVVLFPGRPIGTSRMLAIAGKLGPLFLLNRDNLGKNSGPFGTYQNNVCWCSQSYYKGSDGVGRLVTSTGANVIVWKLTPKSTLVTEHVLNEIPGGLQDPGFFTSVSSNGTAAHSAIIWAVSRPTDAGPAYVLLYAWDASNGQQLLSGVQAGTWPNTQANANIVPVVANGQVFVASNKQLAIFGLGGSTAAIAQTTAAPRPALAAGTHQVYGTITAVDGDVVQLRDRKGNLFQVGLVKAEQSWKSVPAVVGQPIWAIGAFDPATGVLHATTIGHAKPNPAAWPADR